MRERQQHGEESRNEVKSDFLHNQDLCTNFRSSKTIPVFKAGFNPWMRNNFAIWKLWLMMVTQSSFGGELRTAIIETDESTELAYWRKNQSTATLRPFMEHLEQPHLAWDDHFQLTLTCSSTTEHWATRMAVIMPIQHEPWSTRVTLVFSMNAWCSPYHCEVDVGEWARDGCRSLWIENQATVGNLTYQIE